MGEFHGCACPFDVITTALPGRGLNRISDGRLMTLAFRTSDARRRVLAVAVSGALAAGQIIAAVAPAWSQARRQGGPPIIRDAEIEQLLREYSQPVLKVAGLSKQNIQIVI